MANSVHLLPETSLLPIAGKWNRFKNSIATGFLHGLLYIFLNALHDAYDELRFVDRDPLRQRSHVFRPPLIARSSFRFVSRLFNQIVQIITTRLKVIQEIIATFKIASNTRIYPTIGMVEKFASTRLLRIEVRHGFTDEQNLHGLRSIFLTRLLHALKVLGL